MNALAYRRSGVGGEGRYDIRLGFVDAEGMGDQGEKYDTLLFTPVLLHCKCVIFNWMGGVEKDAMLQLLFTLANAAKRIDLSGGGGKANGISGSKGGRRGRGKRARVGAHPH